MHPRIIFVMGLTGLFLLAGSLSKTHFPVTKAQGVWPEMPGYAAMEIPADNPMTAAKVALGNQLFHDGRLSGDHLRNCSFCHLAPRGLTNGQGNAEGPYGVRIPRSPPTLWNAGYYPELFWDGRARSLEDLVKEVWSGPFLGATGQNGHPSMAEVCGRLDAIEGYRSQFQAVFNEGCTPDNVAKAIAAFVRTIVADHSAWARFRSGDKTALSEAAQRGWAVFRGKGRCTNCHDGVLLTDQQFHNVGIGMDAKEPDLGRYQVTKNEVHRGAFKTPTLLDISRTAPYFHDGSAATLEKAMDLMLAGGIDNPNLDEANLRPPVKLSSQERSDLLAFLRELTVESQLTRPQLPK